MRLDRKDRTLATSVLAAFLFAVVALATASMAPLALLVIAICALVAASTGRHLRHGRGRAEAWPGFDGSERDHEGTSTAAP